MRDDIDKMASRLWTHQETVFLIDFFDSCKQHAFESPSRPIAIQWIRQKLVNLGIYSKTDSDINDRIDYVAETWVKEFRSGKYALYHHGWHAIKPEYSRSKLMLDPASTDIPGSSVKEYVEWALSLRSTDADRPPEANQHQGRRRGSYFNPLKQQC